MIKKLTPILFVKAIEPVLPFWIDRLGLQKTIEVPEGDRLGFVILERGNIELMYQTYDSVDRDMPELGPAVRKQAGFLYLEVENLEAIKRAVQDAEVYMTERTTFYGAREIGVKDPAGHFITFAQIGGQTGAQA
jgi:uncharacterized glyoxalase superfamily protein PhnB